MNAKVALVVWMVLIGYSVLEPVDATCTAGPKTGEQLLKSQLFCGYDTSVRPVTANNTTPVNVGMSISSLLFDERQNIFVVHCLMIYDWIDERLRWNTSQFEMEDIVVHNSSVLWVPAISEYVTGKISSTTFRISDSACKVSNNGEVLCTTNTVFKSYCNADFYRWPFDQHTCIVKLSSFENFLDNNSITFGDPSYGYYQETPNRDWELLDYTGGLKVEHDYPLVFFSFVLKRHSGGHAATVFIPSLVLGILTLAMFFIEPSAVERLCLICINIICHSLYLQYLASVIPANGDKYPTILLFFRDSLLLASASLFVTLVVRRLDAASSPPPVWITTITDAVLATLPGQVLMTGETYHKHRGASYDDVTELVETSLKDQRWHLFAVLLDRTFFLVASLTLFILLCALVP